MGEKEVRKRGEKCKWMGRFGRCMIMCASNIQILSNYLSTFYLSLQVVLLISAACHPETRCPRIGREGDANLDSCIICYSSTS